MNKSRVSFKYVYLTISWSELTSFNVVLIDRDHRVDCRLDDELVGVRVRQVCKDAGVALFGTTQGC